MFKLVELRLLRARQRLEGERRVVGRGGRDILGRDRGHADGGNGQGQQQRCEEGAETSKTHGWKFLS